MEQEFRELCDIMNRISNIDELGDQDLVKLAHFYGESLKAISLQSGRGPVPMGPGVDLQQWARFNSTVSIILRIAKTRGTDVEDQVRQVLGGSVNGMADSRPVQAFTIEI